MPRQQVHNFPSDFCCNKNIFTFFLQISQSEQLLTFVLNVKRCINAKKKALSFAHLLITEIHTEVMEMVYVALQKLEKATAVRWKSMFYVHYSFRA